MKKVHYFGGAALLLTLLAFCYFLSPAQAPDPIYKGKPLSQWLAQMENGRWPRASHPADEAVRALGNQGLPLVNQMLRAKDSKPKLELMALWNKQPFLSLNFVSDQQLHFRAVAACHASDALAIGALPAISDLLNNQQLGTVTFACMLLEKLEHRAELVIPGLLRLLANTNHPHRHGAASALGRIHRQPALVIPALTTSLEDPNEIVRFESTRALAKFGPEAKAALPQLIALLGGTSSMVSRQAGSTIFQIDPLAAGRLGIFDDPGKIRRRKRENQQDVKNPARVRWIYRFPRSVEKQIAINNVSGREGAARRFNLDFYSRAFGLPSPKAEGITGRDINDLLAEGRHRDTARDCLRDGRPRSSCTSSGRSVWPA